ncbi:MAG: thermonuclease family protein [Coriobacteriia bacterium]|nr:thermonuclease family protein [Coriobacteriia bacterium]
MLAAFCLALTLAALSACGPLPHAATRAPRAGAVASATPAPNAVETATVVEVTDGDTVRVRTVARGVRDVRLIGMDTPETETRTDPYGAQASAFVRTTVPAGRTVWLEYDVEASDMYGRDLAYLWLSEPTADSARTEMLNAVLVAQGFARLYTYPPNVKYTDLLLALQGEARDANRGLWALPVTEAAEDVRVCVTPHGRAYHRPDCVLIRASEIATLSVSEALDLGKSACRRCQPPR